MNNQNRKRSNSGSGRTLNEKFASLAATSTARKGATAQRQKGQRAAAIGAKRGVQAAKPQQGQKKTPIKGKRVNTKNAKAGGKAGGKKGGRRGQNKKPASAGDLDMEMDKYWFAAGKGPDPVKAALDREMDSYHQAKNAAAPAAATVA